MQTAVATDLGWVGFEVFRVNVFVLGLALLVGAFGYG